MTAVPPFSLERPRYDQSQFLERARHFFELTNPRTLLTTDAELKSAKTLLQQFRDGTLPPGTAAALTESTFSLTAAPPVFGSEVPKWTTQAGRRAGR